MGSGQVFQRMSRGQLLEFHEDLPHLPLIADGLLKPGKLLGT